MRTLATLLLILAAAAAPLAQSGNPKYNTVTLGNNGALQMTRTNGHCFLVRAADTDVADSWFTGITMCAGSNPTIDLNAAVTIGGESLMAFPDPGASRMFYYQNGSPDSLEVLQFGGTCSFSAPTLTCSVPWQAMLGWFGFGSISTAWLLAIAMPKVREARARRRRTAWARA